MDDNIIVAKGGQRGGCFRFKVGKAQFCPQGAVRVRNCVVADHCFHLEQIGYTNQATIDRLKGLLPREDRYDNGHVVGESKAV